MPKINKCGFFCFLVVPPQIYFLMIACSLHPTFEMRTMKPAVGDNFLTICR